LGIGPGQRRRPTTSHAGRSLVTARCRRPRLLPVRAEGRRRLSPVSPPHLGSTSGAQPPFSSSGRSLRSRPLLEKRG